MLMSDYILVFMLLVMIVIVFVDLKKENINEDIL